MRRFPDVCIGFIAVVYVVFLINVNWGRDRWKDIIAYDGKGYYAYLPALWLYNDPQFGFYEAIEAKYYTAAGYFDYREQVGDVRLNKFSAGTALLMAPFFLAGDGLALLTGADRDGWSFPYQAAVNLAGAFYALLGLWLLRRTLAVLGVSDGVNGIVLLSLAFGTHLFYYALCEPSMSHVYSFALMCAWISAGRVLSERLSFRLVASMACLLGLLIIVRPVNGLALFSLPFLAGRKGWGAVVSHFRRHPLQLIGSSAITIAWVGLQLLLNHWQCGKLIAYTYGDQRLDILHPHLSDFLFSFRKGLFLYTPWCLLAVIVSLPLLKKDRWRWAALFAFLFLAIWVVSSWSLWWYGGSFSARPMVDYLPWFALALALGWQQVQDGQVVRRLLPVLLCFVVLLNQVQTYQYRYNILHWDKMDREHYFRIFLRIDQLGKNINPNADLLEQAN